MSRKVLHSKTPKLPLCCGCRFLLNWLSIPPKVSSQLKSKKTLSTTCVVLRTPLLYGTPVWTRRALRSVSVCSRKNKKTSSLSLHDDLSWNWNMNNISNTPVILSVRRFYTNMRAGTYNLSIQTVRKLRPTSWNLTSEHNINRYKILVKYRVLVLEWLGIQLRIGKNMPF